MIRGINQAFQEYLLNGNQHFSHHLSNFNNTTKSDVIDLLSSIGSLQVERRIVRQKEKLLHTNDYHQKNQIKDVTPGEDRNQGNQLNEQEFDISEVIRDWNKHQKNNVADLLNSSNQACFKYVIQGFEKSGNCLKNSYFLQKQVTIPSIQKLSPNRNDRRQMNSNSYSDRGKYKSKSGSRSRSRSKESRQKKRQYQKPYKYHDWQRNSKYYDKYQDRDKQRYRDRDRDRNRDRDRDRDRDRIRSRDYYQDYSRGKSREYSKDIRYYRQRDKQQRQRDRQKYKIMDQSQKISQVQRRRDREKDRYHQSKHRDLKYTNNLNNSYSKNWNQSSYGNYSNRRYYDPKDKQSYYGQNDNKSYYDRDKRYD